MCSFDQCSNEWSASLLARAERIAVQYQPFLKGHVEDVVSEVVLRACSVLHHDKATMNDVQRMLPKMVRNMVIDFLRRSKRRRERSLADFEHLALSRPAHVQFAELTSGLTKNEVHLVIARFIDRRTDLEISAEMGCSRPTVTRRVKEIVEKMKKLEGIEQ